jgi:transposase
MSSAYSDDLRERVVLDVGSGLSRREAGRRFRVSASSAIRWVERHAETGSVSAKPRGDHRRSPLEAHAVWLLELVAREPELTLEETAARIVTELGVETTKSSVDRFYGRHRISFKKNAARQRAGQARRGPSPAKLESGADDA